MAKRIFIFSWLLILLVAVSAAAAQNSPLTNITILLEEAEDKLENDDLTTAQAFISGANALLTPELIAGCDSLDAAKTLLAQVLDTTTLEQAASTLAGAQALLNECDGVDNPGGTLALSQTYESEFLRFDYPDGWLLDENIRMADDVVGSIYVTIAESQELIDSFREGEPGEGKVVFVTVDSLLVPLVTDPTDIDQVAELYPYVLGIANYEYTLDIDEIEVAGQEARSVGITLEPGQEGLFWGNELTAIIMLETAAETPYVLGVTTFNLGDSYAANIALTQEILASVDFSPDGTLTTP